MKKSNIFGNKKSNGVFGLDLGTTNSVITVKFEEGVPLVLDTQSGETTPSCVMFNSDETTTIGRPAYEKRADKNVVYSFKKFMGTDKDLYKGLKPRDIATIFVREMVRQAKELQPQFEDFNSIHVTVPAYFDLNQREDTKLAIEEAGFEVVGIMNEPTAAALVYQQLKKVSTDIIVFDLGGGTFDAVLMRNILGISTETRDLYKALDVVLPKSESILEILDVSGDNRLGGDDIDELAVKLYLEANNYEVKEEDKRSLILTAEEVKKLGVPLTPAGYSEQFLYSYVEQATETILNKAINIMDQMLNRVKVFDPHCVLCGGSTKSPIVKKVLGQRFSLSTEINPDLAVGVGNSIQHWMNTNITGTTVVSRLAKGIGILSSGKINFLAEKGSVVPLTTKFAASNAEPFADFVNIELYQGDRLTGNNTRISTLKLEGLTGHNEQGKITVIISLTVKKDETISVKVEGGGATIESTLTLTTDKEDTNIHPQAKMYNKFKKASDYYNNLKLNNLVNKYGETGERDLAKEIAKMLGELATKAKQQK